MSTLNEARREGLWLGRSDDAATAVTAAGATWPQSAMLMTKRSRTDLPLLMASTCSVAVVHVADVRAVAFVALAVLLVPLVALAAMLLLRRWWWRQCMLSSHRLRMREKATRK